MGAGLNNSLLNCKVIWYQPSRICEITGAWRCAVRLIFGQTYSLGCHSEVLYQFSSSGHSVMEIYFHFLLKTLVYLAQLFAKWSCVFVIGFTRLRDLTLFGYMTNCHIDHILSDSYPTKLREGNIFSCVCLSLGVPCGHYLGCTGPHRTGPPVPSPLYRATAPCTGTQPCPLLPPSDIWWPKLETCLNLFTWGSHCTDHLGYLCTGVDIWWRPAERPTMAERTACIWLECFLVYLKFDIFSHVTTFHRLEWKPVCGN